MAHPVDEHVGKRLRQRRWLVGMTQQQLAEHVGIKFQQIQKYETGANRVSASRLWDIASTLDVSINFFFDGLQAEKGVKIQSAMHYHALFLQLNQKLDLLFLKLLHYCKAIYLAVLELYL